MADSKKKTTKRHPIPTVPGLVNEAVREKMAHMVAQMERTRAGVRMRRKGMDAKRATL